MTDRAARAAADAALADLVAGSGAELLRVAYLLCGDSGRAEDLAQDALLKLLRRWRTGAAADHPRAYARKAIVNEYLGWRRRRASGEVLLMDEPEREQPDAAQRIADGDLAWRLISGLPTRSRAVLVLRYYEQLPDREIAACLDCACRQSACTRTGSGHPDIRDGLPVRINCAERGATACCSGPSWSVVGNCAGSPPR